MRCISAAHLGLPPATLRTTHLLHTPHTLLLLRTRVPGFTVAYATRLRTALRTHLTTLRSRLLRTACCYALHTRAYAHHGSTPPRYALLPSTPHTGTTTYAAAWVWVVLDRGWLYTQSTPLPTHFHRVYTRIPSAHCLSPAARFCRMIPHAATTRIPFCHYTPFLPALPQDAVHYLRYLTCATPWVPRHRAARAHRRGFVYHCQDSRNSSAGRLVLPPQLRWLLRSFTFSTPPFHFLPLRTDSSPLVPYLTPRFYMLVITLPLPLTASLTPATGFYITPRTTHAPPPPRLTFARPHYRTYAVHYWIATLMNHYRLPLYAHLRILPAWDICPCRMGLRHTPHRWMPQHFYAAAPHMGFLHTPACRAMPASHLLRCLATLGHCRWLYFTAHIPPRFRHRVRLWTSTIFTTTACAHHHCAHAAWHHLATVCTAHFTGFPTPYLPPPLPGSSRLLIYRIL